MTATARPGGPPRPKPGDEIWTPEDIKDTFHLTMNQVYKLNQTLPFPVYKVGKHCRYLKSQVLNWFLNQDTRIRANESLWSDRPLDQLPDVGPSVDEEEPKQDS